MSQWSTILIASATVYTIVGIGFLARRRGLLNEQSDTALLKLIIWVLLPCLAMHSIANNPQLRITQNVLLPPLVGSGTVILGFAVAGLFAWKFGHLIGLKSSAQRRTFAICVGMYNFGYIPIPLIQSLFSEGKAAEDTIGILFVHNMAIEITMWTVGIAILTGHLGKSWWRQAITPPGVAIVLALFLTLSGISQRVIDDAPEIASLLTRIVHMLGQTAIPLGLIMIGGTIAEQVSTAKLSIEPRVVAAGSIFRLGLLPATFMLIAWSLPGEMVELRRVVVIQAAMPSAIFPIVLAKHYGGDPPTALRICLGTSLISLLTMPLWLPVGLNLLK